MDQIDFWKLLVLDKNTWDHLTLCKLFVLRMVVWCLIVDSGLLLLVTRNNRTVYKLLLLDRNTWNQVCANQWLIIKLATRRLPFQYLLHRDVGEGAPPFPGMLPFTLDMYLILLSVKQGGIKYHFLKFLVWRELGLNPGIPDH